MVKTENMRIDPYYAVKSSQSAIPSINAISAANDIHMLNALQKETCTKPTIITDKHGKLIARSTTAYFERLQAAILIGHAALGQ